MHTLPEKIREAAMACLTVAKSSPQPQGTAVRFLERLANMPGWTREETDQVRRAVFERLVDSTSGRAS